jgi:hypothetical protein
VVVTYSKYYPGISLEKKQGNHGKKPVRLACSHPPRTEPITSLMCRERYRCANPLEYMEICE